MDNLMKTILEEIRQEAMLKGLTKESFRKSRDEVSRKIIEERFPELL